MDLEIKMPDLATTGSEIKVLQWLVEVGQPIQRGQHLLEVETDKAASEVESVATGVLKAVHVQQGDEVPSGSVIATFEVKEPPRKEPTLNISSAAEKQPASSPAEVNRRVIKTTRATGKRKGMFSQNRRSGPALPGEPQAIELSSIQKTVGQRLLISKQTIPHFYLQTSANAEPMMAVRSSESHSKILWEAFFVRAASLALKKFERMGRRLEGDRLVSAGTDAVGVAIDIENELFVVSIVDASSKSLGQISDEISMDAKKIQTGDSGARKLQPSCMTVSNLGAWNVESFCAIVNPPEASILAIGKILQTVVVKEDQPSIQNRVSLTLSVDHRIVSGKYAAKFLSELVHNIEK